MPQPHAPIWFVNPDDPRAPPQHIWDRLSATERQRIVDELPSEFPATEQCLPEGDHHSEPVYDSREVLRGHYGRTRRRIYVGTNLPIYYSDEPMFAPDVIAVLDVEPHPRDSWVVSAEGKGLDFAMEVHWRGSASKDLRANVERYAALGIREYFVFDVQRLRIRAFRLPNDGTQTYRPVLPQGGLYSSEVLGLQLGIERNKLRYYLDTAPLPYSNELIQRLNASFDELSAKLEQETERAQKEAARADQQAVLTEQAIARADREAAQAQKDAAQAQKDAAQAQKDAAQAQKDAASARFAEARLAEALAEIERLKNSRN